MTELPESVSIALTISPERVVLPLPAGPCEVVMPENIHRLIELLNLQWLLQNRDRTNVKNPIEDLAIRVNL
jgi:hypothetical protein